MPVSTRRELLGSSVAVGTVEVTGCLDAFGSTTDGGDDDYEEGQGADHGWIEQKMETEVREYWNSSCCPSERLAVYTSESAALTGTASRLDEFIAGTDFGSSVLVEVKTSVANSCGELEIIAVELTNEEAIIDIQATQRYRDSDCLMVVSTAGALIRATFEEEPIERVRVTGLEDTLTDGLENRR